MKNLRPPHILRIVHALSARIFARTFLVCFFCTPILATAQTSLIAVDGSLSWMNSSHEITSTIGSGTNTKSLTIGISNLGGGFINKLVVPVGAGGSSIDVMGATTKQFGGGGQSAFLDFLHGNRYNPTQAGFANSAGTVCAINSGTTSYGKASLTIPRRTVCLYAMAPLKDKDGNITVPGYDFTRWENLANDKQDNDNGNSDTDNVAEEYLSNKQTDELTSEFDFYCTYTDMVGATTSFPFKDTSSSPTASAVINVSCIQYKYWYEYARDPASLPHSPIRQFDDAINTALGLTSNVTVTDVSQVNPNSPIPTPANASTPNTLGVVRLATTIRMDNALWQPPGIITVGSFTTPEQNLASVRLKYTSNDGSKKIAFTPYQSEALTSSNATSVPLEKLAGGSNPDTTTTKIPLLILSTSADPNDFLNKQALGIYYPNSDYNKRSVQGVLFPGGTQKYTDDRVMQLSMSYNPNRLVTETGDNSFQLFGFFQTILGLLEPGRTNPGQHERIRGECYILSGTPAQIFANAQRLQPFAEE